MITIEHGKIVSDTGSPDEKDEEDDAGEVMLPDIEEATL